LPETVAVSGEVKPTNSLDAKAYNRDEKLLLGSLGLLILVAVWSSLRGCASVMDWTSAWRWSALALGVPLYVGSRATAPFGRAGAAAAAVVVAAAIILTAVLASGQVSETRGGILVAASLVMLGVPASYFARAVRHGAQAIQIVGGIGLVAVGTHAAMALYGPVFSEPVATAPYVLSVAFLYAVVRRCEQQHYATPVRRRQTLSVTVITKNEADRVERCLQSVAGWADEIIVLDSGSDDETVEIVRRYTDKVWETDWPGYGPQKQRALEKATCDWVLSIDADEQATPELRHDIDVALGAAPACVGYKVPWGVVVYGKLLDFGRSARAPLRVFRRNGSRFTDAQVHETVVLPPGAVGRLRGRLLHYTQRDFGHALEKVATYGWLGARQRYAAGRRGGGLIGACLRSAWVFVQVYLIRLGILDGRAGFLVAALYAQVSFDKYAGLWALRHGDRP